MPDTPDPFAAHLQRAQDLFQAGEVMAAGQIWQAVLRKDPTHAGARACLIHVKHWLDERQKAGDPVVLAPQNQAPLELESIPTSGPLTSLAAPVPVPTPVPAPAPPPPPPAPIAAPAPGPQEEPVLPTPSSVDDVDLEQLIRQGCTLYDMGEVEAAVARWEQVLQVEPDHRLALEYVASARQELARLATSPAGPTPSPSTQSKPEVQELAHEDTGEDIFEGRLFSLLQEGLNRYDQGDTDGAMGRWREMLALDPDNEDAKAYLSMAQRDTSAFAVLQDGRSSSGHPVIIKGKPLSADALEEKCRQGERLMRLKRLEQASFDFEFVLVHDSTHPRALRGFEQVKALLAEQATEAEAEGSASGVSQDAPAVTPPASVTSPGQAVRSGPALPRPVTDMTRDYPWLKSPAVWGGMLAGFLLIAGGGMFFHQHQLDSKLASARAGFSDSALAQVSRGNEPPNLAETPEGIRSEAQQAIGDDPVRSYHRAKELLRLNPGDVAASQLVDRAKAALTEGSLKPTTLADYQKHVQQGDLESAERDVDALLRSKPDDSDLIQRASRLYLVLAQLMASKERWGDARDVLRKGRALNPGDRAWQGRLKLLEKIPNQPKTERPGWIAFLG